MSLNGKMSQIESARLSIHEHLASVGEQILINVRLLVLERLSAADELISDLFQREMETLETLLERQNKQLDVMMQPHIKLHRADVLQLPVCKEERSPSLDQEEPEPPHIKEELLQRPEEVDWPLLTLLAVKVEEENYDDIDDDEEDLSSHCSEVEVELESDTEDSDDWEETSEVDDDERRDKSFSDSGSLKKHQRVHIGEKPFRCKHCNKSFSKSDHVKRHQSVHTGEKPTGEDDCSENRDTELVAGTSTKHMKTQADVEDCGTSHPTSHCSESDITEDSADEWEPCSVHQSPLNTLKSYEKRVEHVEGGQRWSLSNKRSQDLKSSKETHSTLQSDRRKTRFNCTLCSKMFNQRGNLKRHMRTHTGEKPFVCKVCRRLYNDMSNLKRHMRTHTGEKPFVCKVCRRLYNDMSNLKTHMRTHTGENRLLVKSVAKAIDKSVF